MKKNNFFNDELKILNIDVLINKIEEGYDNFIVSFFNPFEEAIKQVYTNQSTSQQEVEKGIVYIKDADYDNCKDKFRRLNDFYKIAISSYAQYHNYIFKLARSKDEANKLKTKCENYSSILREKFQRASEMMHGPSYDQQSGLIFLFEHPDPQQRADLKVEAQQEYEYKMIGWK